MSAEKEVFNGKTALLRSAVEWVKDSRDIPKDIKEAVINCLKESLNKIK